MISTKTERAGVPSSVESRRAGSAAELFRLRERDAARHGQHERPDLRHLAARVVDARPEDEVLTDGRIGVEEVRAQHLAGGTVGRQNQHIGAGGSVVRDAGLRVEHAARRLIVQIGESTEQKSETE